MRSQPAYQCSRCYMIGDDGIIYLDDKIRSRENRFTRSIVLIVRMGY